MLWWPFFLWPLWSHSEPMELWIWLSLLGGVFQAFRVAGQRLIADRNATQRVTPSDWAPAFSRVILGFPIAIVAYLIASNLEGGRATAIFDFNPLFWFWVIVIALFQMTATALQTRLVRRRNFALGVMYVKILILATAVIGVVFFADRFSWIEWLAIGVGTAGVLMMGAGRVAAQANTAQGSTDRSARIEWDWGSVILGLSAGLVLAITGIAGREAADALPSDAGTLSRGVGALTVMLSVQLSVSAIGIWLRDPREFLDLVDRWRVVGLTSLFSIAGSLCWFMAFVLAHPALVNLVGQVEFLVAFGLSILLFRDWPARWELVGMTVTLIGILMLFWQSAAGAV